jgi:hypothetical protein
MRAVIPAYRTHSPVVPGTYREEVGPAQRLLAPLFRLAENSDSIIAGSVGEFNVRDKLYQIPRFIFMGPKGGGDTIRVGIFAAIHGDETEGTETIMALFQDLEKRPSTAKGYHIYAYPVCNPAGFDAATRHNARGQDLAAQFWRGSKQPEVYYLERELGVHHFVGVISLHTCNHAPSHGFFGLTRNSILNAMLVQPALEAARQFILPDSENHPDQSAPSREGFRSMCADFLTRSRELNPAPFEINFETPRLASKISQIQGTVAALKVILESYRTLIATQQDI